MKSSKDKRPKRSLRETLTQEGSAISARSRVAARTDELGAGERRQIVGERGKGPFVLVWGVVVFPGWWLAEWSRKHPFGVWSCSGRDSHDRVPGGPGCSVR